MAENTFSAINIDDDNRFKLELEELSRRGNQEIEKLKKEISQEEIWDDETNRKFHETYGFLVIPRFSDAEECHAMKVQMKEWVDSMWEVPSEVWEVPYDEKNDEVAIFRTDEKQESAQGSNDYFLDSAAKIHFFAEQGAVSDEHPNSLKEEFRLNKSGALNKAGHGLHIVPGTPFYSYTKSAKIQHLVQNTLEYVDPVIPQSMYIFKQPFVGSEVTSHQDSTFLYTTPRQTCLGLWLALDDATLTNGCLWVRPGSHKESLRRKFVRNVEYFGDDEAGVAADTSKPMMIFEDIAENEVAPWDGKLPKNSWPPPCEGLWEAGFIPVECKAGDLVVFPGTLDHLSLPNYSSSQRHTFQLHLVEGPGAGVTWAKSNWLQYTDGEQFNRISKDR